MAKSIAFSILVAGLFIGLILYVDVSGFKSVLLNHWFVKWPVKIVVGGLHFLAHAMAIAALTLLVNYIILAVAIQYDGGGGVLGAFFAPLLAFFMGDDFWTLLAKEGVSETFSGTFEKARVIWGPLLLIPLGGLLGGLVFGFYWAVTCFFFSMHTGDAFGALALRDYKHFLRMKFEADKVTIYAIKLDKVPGRKGWRPRQASDGDLPHNPQLMPIKPLKPELIEPPIEIRAADVFQQPAVKTKEGVA